MRLKISILQTHRYLSSLCDRFKDNNIRERPGSNPISHMDNIFSAKRPNRAKEQRRKRRRNISNLDVDGLRPLVRPRLHHVDRLQAESRLPDLVRRLLKVDDRLRGRIDENHLDAVGWNISFKSRLYPYVKSPQVSKTSWMLWPNWACPCCTNYHVHLQFCLTLALLLIMGTVWPDLATVFATSEKIKSGDIFWWCI